MAPVQKAAQHILRTDLPQIPAEDVEKAKAHVLDAIGCGFYG